MRLPVIEGVIRRRILVNFRVDPQVIQNILPSRFRPKLHKGQAIAGICLIRLEDIRPKMLPQIVGLSSENAAYFADKAMFPRGSAEFDHALIMRNIAHEWRTASDMHV
jgi:hypothetical protein